ncbi:hypothetical protein SAMN05443292_1412 [Halpernia frigidisoli]|uniref:Uncharacterized protein n=1 Tax=Halpernia frigidisoli TaxID=1125876 RepID=A0A1I3FJ09_9FLAO|nr:hypothetical protein SAMN05443292_1412 [Halpernia frigidisoli]
MYDNGDSFIAFTALGSVILFMYLAHKKRKKMQKFLSQDYEHQL